MMNSRQKQAIASKATEAFTLPDMKPIAVAYVASVMQHPWVKVVREPRGFYVQASSGGYVIR